MTTIERLRELERAATEKPGGICFGTIQELELAQATRNAIPAMLAVIEAAERLKNAWDEMDEKNGAYDEPPEVVAVRTALAAFREVRE